MRRFKNLLPVYIAAFVVLFGVTIQAEAQKRNEREVRDIVRSLNSKVDDFQSNLNYQLQSSSADDQDIAQTKTDVNGLRDKIRAFQTNLDQRRENRDDVSAIIDAARPVGEFLASNQQNNKIEDDWNGVRALIERLSASYGITPDWNEEDNHYPVADTNDQSYPKSSNSQNYPASPNSSSISYGLTGTYQLDTSKSDSPDQIISDTGVADAQKQDLADKLDAPEQIAIDIRGNQVTLASSKASPVTVIADGRDKTENDASGRIVRSRVTLKGQELTVSSLGGETDYTIIFSPSSDGRTMKVTRRITTDYLKQTVFADSFYNKTDAVARLGIDNGQNNPTPDSGGYSSNDPTDRGRSNGGAPTYGGTPSTSPARTGNFIVPNGTVITGQLENTIDTKVSQNNDRFKMTVQSPDEFRGATIEGYLTGVGRSGRVSGSSNITFNFEKITLRNGQTYDFAGSLQGIKDQNGKTVKVDTEGTAKGGSQTKETVKRGGIGAGIGAVIGAIAGGGTGAAIGAIIGGGAGAGSVIAQGRDDIQLMKGSTVTIQASAPARNDQARDN